MACAHVLLLLRAWRWQAASPNALPTVLSMWLVIINPISKLALTLAPVAMAVEVRCGFPRVGATLAARVHVACTRVALSLWRCCCRPSVDCAVVCNARCLQELLDVRHDSWKFTVASASLRTALLGVVVLVAVTVPFFSSVMALIGEARASMHACRTRQARRASHPPHPVVSC
jgi:hypothetical protein